jgi:hypothetical protein
MNNYILSTYARKLFKYFKYFYNVNIFNVKCGYVLHKIKHRMALRGAT